LGSREKSRLFVLPVQDVAVVLRTNTNRDDGVLDQILAQVVAMALDAPS
jgi:hypothetical protein